MNTAGNKRSGRTYNEVYRRSIEDPEGYWGEIAESLHWYRKWERVLDDSNPPFYRWFAGGKTNLCYNCLDRHILSGARGKAAIFWESAAQGQSRTITYDELYREVNQFAGVLKKTGVGKGDRVLVYLPMVPEAFVAMLACTRIGAIHSVVFAGFGTDALTSRIESAEPKVIITADGSLRRNTEIPLKETVDISLKRASVDTVIVLDRGIVKTDMKKGRDHYWAELVSEKGEDYVEPVELESTDPAYILYTSGTAGKPYGVVRDTGGYMVALYNSMKQIYGVGQADVYWATSDIGWVVGHSYVIYAPLLAGVTSVMFEGTPDYPDHGVMWRTVEKYGVSVMFSTPTEMRMLRRFGVEHVKKYDTSTLRCLFLAGEILDVPTLEWASDALDGRPVIDHYWTTESGWPIVANMAGVELLPVKAGSPTKPVAGYDLAVVDKKGEPVPANVKGYLVARPPLPPGNIVTLWGDDERYKNEYWQKFRGEMLFATGDYAMEDEDGYLMMLGRADEVLNVAGYRMGIKELEDVIKSHPAVTEASVAGVADALRGEAPVCFAVLNQGFQPSTRLGVEIKKLVRERIGAIVSPKDVRFVPRLPKTKDGRHMRKVLQAVYEGRNPEDMGALEEGASADEVGEAFAEMKRVLK